MKVKNLVLSLSVQAQILVGLAFSANAFDLTGAWATDKSICPQIFTKKAGAISFVKDSDMLGKGFIVEGNNIRGQSTRCVIKSRSEKDGLIHMIASCASDVMVDQVQLSFKPTGDNTITRVFPGIEGTEASFIRCEF